MGRQKRKTIEDNSSPRKSQRGAAPSEANTHAADSSQNKRNPQRCTRCEGRPLRSECIHTKQGRDYILAQEASQTIADAIPKDVPPGVPEQNHETPVSTSTRPQLEETVTNTQGIDINKPIAPGTTTPSTQDTSSLWAGLIDPTLLSMSTPGHINTPHIDTTPVPDPTNESSASTSNTQDVSKPTLSRETSSTPTSKRIRASAKRPIFQHVKGVFRGNVKHDIFRKHARPDPIVSSTLASKTFLEKMNSLLELCEDISLKTGAWLFVGAQHPAATGGALNYSLPRLRRDGGPRTEEFATSFLKLIHKVAEAKRLDTLEFQKVLEEERQRNEHITKELEATRAQAAADSQQLALFRERYGLLSTPDD